MFCRTFALAAVFCLVQAAHATEPPALTLFENVRIFDGKTEALSASMNVLVRAIPSKRSRKTTFRSMGTPRLRS
jgi:hypothetical protein